MGVFHFLNVRHGDCSIIQHASGRVTVVDVCNARKEGTISDLLQKAYADMARAAGNFYQKEYPVNPIAYMKSLRISSVFRFVVTHPDMDHIGGIEDIFEEFSPVNFWDTNNRAEKDFGDGSPYSESDWLFYKTLRDGKPTQDPKRLVLYSGDTGPFYNKPGEDGAAADGLHVLAPSKQLMAQAIATDDYNDASYVILYRTLGGGRILLAGDSHDATWDHIIANHYAKVKNVDLLIAPHHGRKSDRSYQFLDVVNPTVTFFGNANSEHLAYGAWNYRKLFFITNNQANCMIVNANVAPMELYITNERFAREQYRDTTYSPEFGGWFLGYFQTP